MKLRPVVQQPPIERRTSREEEPSTWTITARSSCCCVEAAVVVAVLTPPPPAVAANTCDVHCGCDDGVGAARKALASASISDAICGLMAVLYASQLE